MGPVAAPARWRRAPTPSPTPGQFDWGCTNSGNGALNGYGWNCAFYSYYGTSYCTYESWSSPGEVYYDDDDFTAVDMCCACSAPTMSPTVPTCYSTDAGALDPYGDDCDDYVANPGWCGDGTYDDDDFSHDEMCCACGGGSEGGFCVDHLTVNDVQYCDEHGPQGVAVTDSTSITFISDYNNGGHAGFSICLASSFTGTEPPPTATPTIGPCETGSTYFSVTEGNCTACDNCFYSPNHVTGGHYHDDWHDCTITPLQSGYLDVQAFSIEESTYWGCM